MGSVYETGSRGQGITALLMKHGADVHTSGNCPEGTQAPGMPPCVLQLRMPSSTMELLLCPSSVFLL